MESSVVVFVLGAPGAGKGTQCAKIVEKYGWTHLSTGDLLRAEVAAGTELGQEASEIMQAGEMVPTSLVLDLLVNAMQSSASNRFLIDGFPRKLDQLLEFESKIKPADAVLAFTLDDEAAVERLVKRGETSGRADDNEETIRNRLQVFKEESQPVIEHLKEAGATVVEIESLGSPDEVFAQVEGFMDEMEERAASLEAAAAAAAEDVPPPEDEGEEPPAEPEPEAEPAEPEPEPEPEPEAEDEQAPPAEGEEEPAEGAEGEGLTADAVEDVPVEVSEEAAAALQGAKIVFVLGAPGAGKGTQCSLIVETFGWTHLSTGDLLRKEVQAGTPLGAQAADIMRSGDMVPTGMILQLLLNAMVSSGSGKFLVDGFPRTLAQLELFEAQIRPCDAILVFGISEEAAVERLIKRGLTSGRADDNEETIRNRLQVFYEESQPVIDRLKDEGRPVQEVDAVGSVEEIFSEVKRFMIELDGPPPTDMFGEEAEEALAQPEEELQYTPEQEAALIKIQAAGRGMIDRKKVADMKADGAEGNGVDEGGEEQGQQEEVEVLEQYTPEQEAALIKIQAAGRGMIDRKKVAEMKAAQHPDDEQQPAVEEAEEEVVVVAEAADAVPDLPPPSQGRLMTPPKGSRPGTSTSITSDRVTLDLNFSEEQIQAVIKIQAAGRGMIDRKKVSEIKRASELGGSVAGSKPASRLGSRPATSQQLQQQQSSVGGAAPGSLLGSTDTSMLVNSIHHLLVVCGPSGVGKGTLIEKLMLEHGDKFGFSVSHTTRGPRPGEVDGKHYHFTTIPDMEPEVARGMFLEHAKVHGNMYGTSLAAVARVCADGKVCVLDIDVQGADKVRHSVVGHKALYVFVAPPSMETLEARLRGRGTETEDKIQTRLANAAAEIERSNEPGFFNAVLVNDDLERAYGELKNVIGRHIPGLLPIGAVPPASSKPSTPVKAPSKPATPQLANGAPPPAANGSAAPSPRVGGSKPSTPLQQQQSSKPSTPLQPQLQKPATPQQQHTPPPPPAAAPAAAHGSKPAVPKAMPVRQYMDHTVVPVLREALRALNETRPDDALQFLADYLLSARAKMANNGL